MAHWRTQQCNTGVPLKFFGLRAVNRTGNVRGVALATDASGTTDASGITDASGTVASADTRSPPPILYDWGGVAAGEPGEICQVVDKG